MKYSIEYIDFPYYLYDYGFNSGVHTGEQEIKNEAELKTTFEVIVAKAMEQKRRCIITDMWGNCLFLTENAVIRFPTRKQFKMMTDFDVPVMEW